MKYLLMSMVFISGLALGFWSTNFYNKDQNTNNNDDQKEIRSGGYTFVNPLLECEQGADFISKNSIKPFKPVIQKIIDKAISENKANHVSVYFRDLNNGPWFGINEEEKFSPASLMKLPLLMHYLKLAENTPEILGNQIEFGSGGEKTIQYYKPDDPVTIGKTYTIKDLLEHAIKESDNNAALLLLQTAGKDKFLKIFRELGLDNPIETDRDYLSVKSYATFFRVLFNASYLSGESSESALKLLSEVKFKSGLVSKLPSSIVVSHKFGEILDESSNKKQLHDCGIVYYPNKPYLICVMTRGTDFDSLAGIIADISKATYNEIEKQQN